MATASFDKNFVVTDTQSIKTFKHNLQQPRKIQVASRNLETEKVKGIQLLKQRLLVLESC